MNFEPLGNRGIGKIGAIWALSAVALVVIAALFAGPLRRYVRESFMQRVTSAHYEILCPAGALSHIAWGEPASPLVAHWTALWLIGQSKGQELGMAAAEVEQKLGHKKVANLLGQPSDGTISAQDRALLGAAWVNAIAELGGPAKVRQLYSAKMTKLDVSEVTKALGTNSTELERKWQMWMYAYIAGMPPATHSMT